MDELDVQRRARAFVESVDTADIRNDLTAYILSANAKVRTEILGVGESGFTITRPDGKHIITVNANESEARQRYTVCHEIGHIILSLPSSHTEGPLWGFVKRDLNEVYCDSFAAELLMPVNAWRLALPNGDPSFELIEFMAAAFNVSFPAAASRLATLSDEPCAFVTMDKGFIRYSARSTPLRQASAWIPPRSPIPEGSVAFGLRAAGQSQQRVGETPQDIWFSDWERGADLWEMARHYRTSDTTVSVLWLDDADLPEPNDRRRDYRADDEGLAELTGELPWPGKRKRQ